MAKKDAALLKRQQIARANRMMFMWIIGASVIVGAAGVSSLFMVRKAAFNNKILTAENKTIKTLKDNNAAVDELRKNVRVLNTDPALASAKAFSDEQTIRVILDALPDEKNIPALGASLQKELINVPGVDLESLGFTDLSGGGDDQAALDDSVTEAPTGVVSDGGSTIAFTMRLNADSSGSTSATQKLDQVLRNLERSIRAVKILNSKLEISPSGATMVISAVAYYQPAVSLELKNETIKP